MTSHQQSPRSGLRDGLVAGAVGTTVLTAVTYADMAWRGRDASSTPEETVTALAGALGTSVGGSRHEAANRTTALGALSGTVAGLASGAVVGLARRAGLRLPAGVGGVVTGAVAMAATDLPAHALGVTDLRDWTAQDWVSDALPHLAFGVATHGVLRRLDPRPPRAAPPSWTAPSPPGPGCCCARPSSASPPADAPPSVSPRPPSPAPPPPRASPPSCRWVRSWSPTSTPPPPAASPRRASRCASSPAPPGAAALAHRDGRRTALPVLAGALGAVAGTFAGASWRSWATSRDGLGWEDRQAALAEDVVATGLALLASRG